MIINFSERARLLFNLNASAQAILDSERPGEKVQEVLINTDSAASVKELLEPKPTKTVYQLGFRDNYSKKVFFDPDLGFPRKTKFDDLEGAADELAWLKNRHPDYLYFIVQSDVEA